MSSAETSPTARAKPGRHHRNRDRVGGGRIGRCAVAGRRDGEVSTVRREFEFGGRRQALAVCPAPELPLDRPEMRVVRRMDRCAQLGWWAAREAWLAAGLEPFPEARRAGVMLGTSRGALGKLKEGFTRLDGPRYPPSLSADGTIACAQRGAGASAQAPRTFRDRRGDLRFRGVRDCFGGRTNRSGQNRRDAGGRRGSAFDRGDPGATPRHGGARIP